jgi:hypothetical protein
MKNPNKRLLTLIKRHKLKQMDVAHLCRCGRTSVYYWTREPDHKDFTPMSGTHLRLLELELGEVQPEVTMAAMASLPVAV